MKRSKEITEAFLRELDKHLEELKEGKAESTFEVQDIAALLHIAPHSFKQYHSGRAEAVTLSSGLLSGELTGQFAPGDFRAHAPRYTGENFEANKQKVTQLQERAKSKGCTASQLALAWVLHQGNDMLPLLGTTKQSRLKENIEAADIQLTTEELDWLDKTFPEGAFSEPGMQLLRWAWWYINKKILNRMISPVRLNGAFYKLTILTKILTMLKP